MRKGSHHSKEAKQKLSIAGLGRRVSEKTKKKISEKMKGTAPWNKGTRGIYHHSKETKQKISQIAKRNWADREYREKITEKRRETIRKLMAKGEYPPWNRGKHGVQDYSGIGEKISKALKGRKLSEEHKRKMSIAQKRLWSTDSHRKKMHNAHIGYKVPDDELKRRYRGKKNPFYGKKHSIETRKIMSELAKKHWKDEAIAKKMIWGLQIKPNGPELYLDYLLQNYFPNEWKYVGEGQVIIGGLCPDFINCNGKKQIIELFGGRWHKGDRIRKNSLEDNRRKIFKEFGFNMIVIWDNELREPDKIIKKITEEFHDERNKR